MSAAEQIAADVAAYTGRGWPVFPIYSIVNGRCACNGAKDCSPGKHPMTSFAPQGFKDATLDPAVIAAWSRVNPNVGIATGHGLLVVDVDTYNGGDDTIGEWAAKYGPFPETPRVVTGGGGFHLYFAADKPYKSRNKLGQAVDIKCAGAYVVAPPSVHKSGRRYLWDAGAHLDDVPLAPVPAWLTEMLSVVRPGERVEWSGVSALESVLGEAFRAANMLGLPGTEGRYWVRCPWAHEHTDGRGLGKDSSTVILPPPIVGGMGSFVCSHGHCEGRGYREALAALPSGAERVARRKYPPMRLVSPASSGTQETAPPVEGWNSVLHVNRRGEVDKSQVNVTRTLLPGPDWQGRVWYDLFAERVMVKGPAWAPDEPARAWQDVDTLRLINWLRDAVGVEFGDKMALGGVVTAAHEREEHPVRAYLAGLSWDGRTRHLWPDYFGSERGAYELETGARWLRACVARAFEPGCKVDNVPILEGPEGVGKSRGLRILAGDAWFGDSPINIGRSDKDAFTNMTGKWIWELAELTALGGPGETEKVKAFVSLQTWTGRQHYGRVAGDFPRQVVFAGSTNKTKYLYGDTGNRRFWPVRCGHVDTEGLARDRDQLWAEAVHRYRNGEPWHVDTPELRDLCVERQDDRTDSFDWSEHPWVADLRPWLDRKAYARETVTTAEAMAVLNVPVERRDNRGYQTSLGHILKSMGWHKPDKDDGSRPRKYFYAP